MGRRRLVVKRRGAARDAPAPPLTARTAPDQVTADLLARLEEVGRRTERMHQVAAAVMRMIEEMSVQLFGVPASDLHLMPTGPTPHDGGPDADGAAAPSDR